MYQIVSKSAPTMWIVVLALTFFNVSRNPRVSSQVTAEEIDQLIKRDIPKGSNIFRVTAWLDTHKVEHSRISEHLEDSSEFQYLELHNKEEIVKGYIVSLIRDANKRLFTSSHIQMYFYFDRKDALITYSVKGIADSSF